MSENLEVSKEDMHLLKTIKVIEGFTNLEKLAANASIEVQMQVIDELYNVFQKVEKIVKGNEQ